MYSAQPQTTRTHCGVTTAITSFCRYVMTAWEWGCFSTSEAKVYIRLFAVALALLRCQKWFTGWNYRHFLKSIHAEQTSTFTIIPLLINGLLYLIFHIATHLTFQSTVTNVFVTNKQAATFFFYCHGASFSVDSSWYSVSVSFNLIIRWSNYTFIIIFVCYGDFTFFAYKYIRSVYVRSVTIDKYTGMFRSAKPSL